MRRVNVAIAAAAGGAVGIALAAARVGVPLDVVAALVAMVAAVVALPSIAFVLARPSTSARHYQRLLETAAAGSLSGPSLAHTRDLMQLAGNAYDLHFRLRPILVEAVRDLLALRERVDLDAEPERAGRLLGAELWELIRPSRPVPEGRFGDPGLDTRRLQLLVDDLERIGG